VRRTNSLGEVGVKSCLRLFAHQSDSVASRDSVGRRHYRMRHFTPSGDAHDVGASPDHALIDDLLYLEAVLAPGR
jgi:hypothetical protein